MRAIGVASILVLAACHPRAPTPAPTLRAPENANVQPFSFDRPPILAIARAERMATKRRPVPKQAPDRDPYEPEEVDNTQAMERTVTVRRRGLATEEDLAGYLIRAYDKTPSGLHPTRALAQIRGPVRSAETDSSQERRDARAKARATVVNARRQLKRCYSEKLARDPRVIVKAPVGLVFEQAIRLDAAKIKLDVDLHVAGGRTFVTGVHARNVLLYEDDVECFEDALGGSHPAEDGIDTQVNLVLFIQREHLPQGENPATVLSLAAAAFGWLEFQQDRDEEALELFEDAAWLYQLPEYQVLVGMAHERLGHARAASKAYRAYLEGRPGAPDADEFEARLEALE